MKQGYSKPLKFISILLLIAMLATSQSFTILAAEVAAEVANEAEKTADSSTLNDLQTFVTEESAVESHTAIEQQTSETGAVVYSTVEEPEEEETTISHVAQPFEISVNDREYVNLNTGSLEYTETLVTIPGINNQDFHLNIRYDSADSYLEKPIRSHTEDQTYNEKRFDIGSGWSFDIPAIDYGDEDESQDDRLILPGVGTFSLFITLIKDYLLEDMDLDSDSSYNNGQFDSAKKLKFADGTVYYFNEDGLFIAAVDRFNNTMTYKYVEVDGEYRLAEIIDITGNSTTIAYAETETGKTVTITAPDNNDTVLHIKALDSTIYDESDSVLEKIVYTDGETVHFEYDIQQGTVSSSSASGGAKFHYALLKNVSYDTGAKLGYVYALHDIKYGKGHLGIYRLTERYTVENDEYSVSAGRTTYTYTGDYSLEEEYKTKVIEHMAEGNVATEYTFNEDHLCTKQETYHGKTLKTDVSTTYDSYNLPKEVITNIYGSGTITLNEYSIHDEYGNTTVYYSPKAQDATNSSAYRTTYTYDTEYQLPLIVEYRQNASTDIKLENVLTDDKKSIAQTNTYVNDVLVAKTAYTYDAQGRVKTETAYADISLDNGIVTEYTYSGANLASKTVKNVVGNDGISVDLAVSYTYDTMGRPLTETDVRGNRTTYTYDSRGRVTSVTLPDGSITAYTYNLIDNRTSIAASGREPVVYNYDGLGRLETVAYASGDLTVENFYDNCGKLIAAATNPDSTAASVTYYTYDLDGRVVETTIYDSEQTLVYKETYTYDDAYSDMLSLVTKTVHGDTDAADVVTKTYTNKYGEKVKEDVGGIITEYEYDHVGNLVRVYYDDTTLAAYTYDYAGNVLTETNADGNTRTVTYDALGRKLTESDFKGNVTSYTYDNAGRLLTMTTPLTDDKNSVTKYYYDANGNIVKQEQSAEAEDRDEIVWCTVEQVYDSMNRVTDIVNYVSDSSKQYTHYAYNLAGDLTDVYTGMTVPFAVASTDSYSHIKYTYDDRGNNVAITDTLGQTESYTYDVLGMLTETEQRDGTEIVYTYDALGNVVADTVGTSGKNTTYTLTGAIKSVAIDGETVEYSYDGMGNVLTETEGDIVKSYTYDSRGRKSGYTLTVDGETISTATYTYDTSNRLISVTEGGQTTTYTYDANGNRASQTTGNVTTTYTYNKANLVTSMTNIMGGVVISSFTYTYYADGNMHTKTETQLGTVTTTTYVYDGMGRLESETIGEDVISYYYDANGNRTLMNNDGVITSYTYDKNNRLLTETSGGETITYTYDVNGNTLTAGDKTYTYNAWGQQISYSDGTTTASYAYNPSGLRSSKTVGGSTKYFVYNGMQIVFEYEDSVSDGTTYYYGLNRTHSSDGDIFVYNAHGDTVQLVNTDAVAASYTYDAFGNLTNTIGTSDNAFLYCSEYFDAETETYYLRARYYNPANGRFTQQDAWAFMDSADPLTLNLYTYCANNPVLYVDPSGHWVHLVIGAVVGGVLSAVASVASQVIENKGDFSKVDGIKVLTAAGTGAVSGLIASTGIGLAGQVVINAGLSAANAYVDQTYEIYSDKYDREEYDLMKIGVSAAVGGVAGYVGGPGAGNSAMNSLSNQLTKRISNAVNHLVGKGAFNEIQKAIVYYSKSSYTLITNEIIKNVVKASGVTAAYSIIDATELDDKAKAALMEYVDSLAE